MSEPTLKPCLRCQKPQAKLLGGPQPFFGGYRVACSACGLTGLKFWKTKEAAARWWNHRARTRRERVKAAYQQWITTLREEGLL